MGARVGATVHREGMAQYRAVIDYGYIKEFAHNPEGVKSMLDDDLDSELVLYEGYRKSHFAWLFPKLQIEGDKYARRAAQYRLHNPHSMQFPDFPPGTPSDVISRAHSNYRARALALKKILDSYRGAAQPSASADPYSVRPAEH